MAKTINGIAWRSFIGNISSFRAYFLATSFSVMIYFMNSMLLLHPDLPLDSLHINFSWALKAVNFVLLIFLALFIFYSVYTYLKMRSRDYAMYKILGMRPDNLLMFNFVENFMVFFGAVGSGVLSGMLLEKLFFMLISKIMGIDDISFYWPGDTLIEVVLIFGTIFIGIFTLSSILIRVTSIKRVLSFGRESQKVSRVRIPVAIFGILVILAGYYFAWSSNSQNLGGRIIPVTLTVIFGTYIFYNQVVSFIISLLKRVRPFYYKGVNIIWLSDLSFRVKDSTLVLFLTTIIMAVGLTVFSSVFSVMTSELEGHTDRSIYPLSLAMESGKEGDVPYMTESILDSAGVKYSKLVISGILGNYDTLKRVYMINRDDLDGAMIDGDHLKEEISKGVYFSKIKMLSDNEYKLLRDSSKMSDSFKSITVTLYKYKERYILGKELGAVREHFYNTPGAEPDFYATYFSSDAYNLFLYIYSKRFYIFISLFFASIFFICAASMLYFKFFNHLEYERIKYKNLIKMGLSKRDVLKSGAIQMAILFFIPNLLALLHTGMALLALSNVTPSEISIAIPVAKIFGVVFLMEVVYFAILVNRYNHHLVKVHD